MHLPRCWLMIDRRLGPALAGVVAAMPARSGVIIRPYAMDPAGRAATIRAIRRVARAKRHMVLIAGRSTAGFDGQHRSGPAGAAGQRRTIGLLSMPVHDGREAARARRAGADICLISPVLPTRSHPGGATLGPHGFARLARRIGQQAVAIALGGMDAEKARRLKRFGAHGWAAIDAWQI